MVEFFSGITCMGCFVAILFFFKFWKQTGDRFFGLFGLAFAIFGLNRIAITVFNSENENNAFFYLLRLLAFILILYAIIDKNRVK
jgi:hypothetical protein